MIVGLLKVTAQVQKQRNYMHASGQLFIAIPVLMVGFSATKPEFSDWKKLKILYLFVGGNNIDSRRILGGRSVYKTEKEESGK